MTSHREGGINWDLTVQYQIDGYSITVPTYGYYGGPLYPLVYTDGPTLDALDALFKVHDEAYLNILTDPTIPNPSQPLAVADEALLYGIMGLTDDQLGGEAHLYAGVTELALLYNIVVNYDAANLLTVKETKAIVADAIDNLAQATIDPLLPDPVPGPTAGDFTETYGDVLNVALQFASFDFGALLDDAASQLPKKYQAVLTSPKIEAALTDAFDFTDVAPFSVPVESIALTEKKGGPSEKAFEAYDRVVELVTENGAGPPAGHGPDFFKPGQAHLDHFFWAA